MDVMTIFDRMQSHAMTLGLFDRVNTHEITQSPGNGLTAAVWVDRIQSVRSSGLDSTSVRVAFNVRIYCPVQQEPLDMIDPALLSATDALMALYSGDFTLDGSIRHVDLLGLTGTGLEAAAGYINIDGILHRVMTITVPVIVNDCWEQEV